MNAQLPMALAPAFAPHFFNAILSGMKTPLASDDREHLASKLNPSERFMLSLDSGWSPSAYELIEICTKLHEAMIRANSREGLTELDYLTVSFEDMADVVSQSVSKLSLANGERS